MPTGASKSVTILLQEAQAGREDAVEELFSAVYGELRAIAARRMSAEACHILQPTALVNETYLRLFGEHPVKLTDRKHFFSVAATAMSHVLIDFARAERSAKRGAGAQRVTVKSFMQVAPSSADEAIRIQEAIDDLGRIDVRAAEALRLAYFAGCDTAQIAEFLHVSQRTAQRDLNVARAFLERRLRSHGAHS